jgi:hypothetical protein
VSHDPDVADLGQVGGDLYGHLGGLPLDSVLRQRGERWGPDRTPDHQR